MKERFWGWVARQLTVYGDRTRLDAVARRVACVDRRELNTNGQLRLLEREVSQLRTHVQRQTMGVAAACESMAIIDERVSQLEDARDPETLWCFGQKVEVEA